MNKLITIVFASALSAFIASNILLVFKEDSEIARKYYIDEYARVSESDYKRELEKEAVTAPATTFTIRLSKEEIQDVLIKVNDPVQSGEILATYNSTDMNQKNAEWEAMERAYQTEVQELQTLMTSLNIAKNSSDSTSSNSGRSSSSSSTTDNVIDVEVDLIVNVDLQDESTYDAAISEIEQKMAEIQRELTIVQAQLSYNAETPQFVSPIDGVVEEVREFENDLVIDIVPEDQILVTFVEEKHWHEIEAAQPVQAYSTHLAKSYAAQVAGKGTMPVTDNRWKEIHGQFEQHPDLPLYEIQVTPAEPLEGLPFGANVNTIITIDQATGAMRLRDDWTITRNKEYAEIYSISTEGKIGRIPVAIAFDMPETQSVIVDDGLVNGQIVLDDTFRRNNARTFFPQPLELPSWATVKALGWKDYMAFLIQKPYVPNTEEDVEEEVDAENAEN
ncbi:hypothetical protein LG275_12505 [Chryseomicrobium palamuruense]